MADINSSVRYAASGSPGIFSDRIGWLDFSGLPGDGSFVNNTTYSVINTISRPPGYTINFNIKISQTYVFGYNPIDPLQPPVYPTAVFGNTAYLGIIGNIDLYMRYNAFSLVRTIITLSNMQVFDNFNVPVSNYDIISADGESTNLNEDWNVYSNGSPWTILQILPPIIDDGAQVDITGQGTNTIKSIGTTLGDPPSIIVSSASPTTVTATLDTLDGKQGIVFGIMIPSTSLAPGSENYTCC